MATSTLDLSALANSEEASIEVTHRPVPTEVQNFVDAAYKFWEANPKKWRKLTLATEDAVKEVIRLARKHAKHTGRSLRVNTLAMQKDPKTLIYKVTDPPATSNGEAASEGETE